MKLSPDGLTLTLLSDNTKQVPAILPDNKNPYVNLFADRINTNKKYF